ncbi:predicted protein [Phaeodactylum tricornutum CCAP 1055/1]|jgi:ribosomal protein S18 acetylase RimI-like enzyme|uniref:N-acetyltransferase domain-containing protein n=2 Tax=Phaeodactylum tricornutum TaxID=2850 RepID=B7FSR9_PHATC|nr:predicted protein [Phaeodactylum tricornutum CCAP 1055/1]EEC50528.1 predicted protein [Phaeodactylum tricornutum CCAP 1055/1]|eukprot:XP_002177714.1 predicted protein [Phaeodactylum tricornutum CCAP 1055/1]
MTASQYVTLISFSPHVRYLCLLSLSWLSVTSHGFALSHNTLKRFAPNKALCSPPTRLDLISLVNFRDEITFFDKTDDERCCINRQGEFRPQKGDVFELALAEETDLPDVSRFIVTSFGADAIRVSQDMSTFEGMLMRPAVELVNGYSGIVAFAEVLAGLRSRLKTRIANGSDLSLPELKGRSRTEQISEATNDSIVLVLGRRHAGNDWHIDVIASVELRLQLCDAKIPFSLPWLDRIERTAASWIGLGKNHARDLQPYLGNLCVAERYRGRGIGRALVRCVEDISKTKWGYSRIYLHVDKDNAAALNLYQEEGYRDVGLRWKPFWAGKAVDIGYYVKGLNRKERKEYKASLSIDKKENKSDANTVEGKLKRSDITR